MLEWKKTYECASVKCKFRFQVIADVERDNIIEMPVSCCLPDDPRSDTVFIGVDGQIVSRFVRRPASHRANLQRLHT
jgi:hypothetical protein